MKLTRQQKRALDRRLNDPAKLREMIDFHSQKRSRIEELDNRHFKEKRLKQKVIFTMIAISLGISLLVLFG